MIGKVPPQPVIRVTHNAVMTRPVHVIAKETPIPAADTPFILEQHQRLSGFVLWTLQRRFFELQGIDAWRNGTVPHYVTSNPFIANAYAHVVFGCLRDCDAVARAADHAAGTPFDPSQPVYIMDLGAGSGHFAYHFLKTFGISQIPVDSFSPPRAIPTTF